MAPAWTILTGQMVKAQVGAHATDRLNRELVFVTPRLYKAVCLSLVASHLDFRSYCTNGQGACHGIWTDIDGDGEGVRLAKRRDEKACLADFRRQ